MLRKEKFKLKVVIIGPDGAGKSSVIQGITRRWNQAGRAATVRHLKPSLILRRRGEAVTIVPHPHGKPPRSPVTSVAKICVWLVEEWYAHLFQDKKGQLLICDRYYHDLLVDPLRYRYGGPPWAARLVGKMMPKPDLWVLLDAPAVVLQTRKQEVTPEETARQCAAYRNFVRSQGNHAIVDASQPLNQVIAEVEKVLVKNL